ncbi:MAG TPA: ATP-binding protein [Burkholderiaceae bacterium]|nr:ATP-binding protein [Burkholderiaceae bacterium]
MRLLIALLIALTACAAPAADPPGAVLRLDHADFLASDAAEPPSDTAAWQPQSLPDDWDTAHAGLRGVGWYRLRFELTPPVPAKPAIYLPLLRNVGAVYLNGALVGSTGVFGRVEPVAAPVLFAIEPRQLRAGSNTLHVRLWAPPGRLESLDPVSIGERPVFEAELERERFMHVTLPQMAGAFSAAVSLYMLVLWLHRRHDEVYGYFAAAALTHALYLVTTVPIGGWKLMLGSRPFCAVFWFASTVFLFIFSLRFAGWRAPRAERGVWLYALLMWMTFAGGGLYTGQHWQHWIALAGALSIEPGSLVIPAASLIVLLCALWQRRSSETLLLALCALYSVTVLTMGWLMPRGLGLGETHIVPLFVVMGWILTRRFVSTLNETDALNAHLEERVAERHAELEREQAKLQALTREQAIGEERERIIADMHDGLGARLISTLANVEHGEATAQQVGAALRESIDDLRLAIDSLQPTDDDLLLVLGNLRYRLENRLRAHGIALDWQVGEVPKLSCLTPRNVLHLLRILQEAFTNVVQHAQARNIRVATAVDARRVKIDVADDGRGFDVDQAESAGKAQGLAKMRRRAMTIGGELLVMPSPGGTTLSLLLPRG